MDPTLEGQAAGGQPNAQAQPNQLDYASAGDETAGAAETGPADPYYGPWWLRAIKAIVAIGIALAMARGAFLLYIQHNDFPVYYHPDEWSKSGQVNSEAGTRNFNHPLLMLEAAKLVKDYYNVESTQYDMVVAGRKTSAGLAAIGVFAVALAGYVGYGFTGLLIGGLVIGLAPQLLIHAHYFKEDTALLAGIMVAILGARLVLATRDTWLQVAAAVVLGLGCGAATSGKYVGIATVIPCLVPLAIARFRDWLAVPLRVLAFLAGGYATVVYINYRAFIDWTSLKLTDEALSSVQSEFGHATTGHYGIKLAVPNMYCINIAASQILPHLWVFAAVGIVSIIYRRRISRWGLTLAAFLATYVVVLVHDPIPIPRYALPISIIGFFIAAQLASSVIADLWKRPLQGATALTAVLLAVIGVQLRQCLHFNARFLDDPRQRLWNELAKLPPGTRGIAERYTNLDTQGDARRFPNQPGVASGIVHVSPFASSRGTLDQLAQQGYQYIAVANANYDRFFAPGVGPVEGSEAEFDRNKAFYEDLFTRGELVWRSVPRIPSHSYVDMEERLYKIDKLTAKPRPPQ